jgi:hypothetical protein
MVLIVRGYPFFESSVYLIVSLSRMDVLYLGNCSYIFIKEIGFSRSLSLARDGLDDLYSVIIKCDKIFI